jgi:hypothetical protein
MQLNLYNIYPRAFPKLMRDGKSLFPLRITNPSWLHNDTRIRPCCATLRQRAWIDD